MEIVKLVILCCSVVLVLHSVHSAEVAAQDVVEESAPVEVVEVLEVEPEGHENTSARKTRQFGFGYPPPPPPFGFGGFGGGYGGGYGGGFQRTRIVTRTRVVNRFGGGYGGGYGGGFYG